MQNYNSKIKILYAFVLFLFIPSLASASTLYFLPQAETFYSGDTFVVEVRIDTQKKEINALEGIVVFNNNKLRVEDLGKGGSMIGLWIKDPIYSNEKGEIKFAGGVPNGFQGEGIIFKITFKALSGIVGQNEAEIYFDRNSRVLLNDGKGTEDNVKFLSGIYKVTEKEKDLPVISSTACPDQDKWCRIVRPIELHWDLISGAEYSYILSRDASMEPDDIPDKPEGELEWMGDILLQGIKEDGIYYFQLKQKLPGKSWSNKTTFRIMIDNAPPKDFVLQFTEIEKKRYLIFQAEDKVSGVDHYLIKESKKTGILDKFIQRNEIDFQMASSPYLLQSQDSKSIITVKAIDKAGNEKIAIYTPDTNPEANLYYKVIGIIAIFACAWLFVRKLRNNRRVGV